MITTFYRRRSLLLALSLGLSLIPAAWSYESAATALPLRVLIFSRVAGYYHQSIDTVEDALTKWGAGHNWEVTKTRDTILFTSDELMNYDVVVWNNNCAATQILPTAGLASFERYIRSGGGYAGIHGAAYCYFTPTWTFYVDSLVGAREVNTGPCHLEGLCTLSVNIKDPTTEMFPPKYTLFDEYYSLTDDITKQTFAIPSDTFEVLVMAKKTDVDASCDYRTGRHPVSWRHTFHAGRAFYTEVGHEPATFRDSVFIKHLAAGIQWAGTKTVSRVQQKSIPSVSMKQSGTIFTLGVGCRKFRWQCPEQSSYKVTIFDIRGRTLLSKSGIGNSFYWNGLVDMQGSPVPPGMYCVRLESGRNLVHAVLINKE